MKTKQNKTLAVVIMLAATLAISSCQKEKIVSKTKTSNEPVQVEETINDLQRTILFDLTRNFSFKTESCEVVTDDTVSVPHIRTIDYGSGCTDSDGKVRKGQIIITYDTDDLRFVSGANSHATFNNYFIDDNQITGTMNIHNDGVNGSGNYEYTVNCKFDKTLANNQGVQSIIGEQVMEWISGANTPEASDNEYLHSGSVDGVNVDGSTFTVTVTQPLLEKRASGCERHFVSGVTLLQSSTASDKYTDYGNGTCDDLAVETVDGVSQTVTLQ